MVPAQGWHALIEKVSTFFLSPGSHVFFTLVSSSCFPDQHICADIPITHRWQVAGCSNPLKYWFQKTTIWFMLLACFPEHIHVESCVEKKSNQRFLKLQFLYFIGMEAWRLLFSHNFVKTWPVSKETGLFYVSMIVFVCLCAKQKKNTHKKWGSSKPRFWPDPPPTRQPCLVFRQYGIYWAGMCWLHPETPSFWGGKLLQNWALFEVDQRHLQLLCWCVVRVSLLSCLRPWCKPGQQSEWNGVNRARLVSQSSS